MKDETKSTSLLAQSTPGGYGMSWRQIIDNLYSRLVSLIESDFAYNVHGNGLDPKL